LKENWANGDYAASFTTEMIARNAGATGACSMIKEVLDIELDTLLGVSNEK